MSVIVSHPTGNANVRAVLRSLAREGLLERFHTTLALPELRWLGQLAPGLDRRLGQRRFPELPWSRIAVHPSRELVRQAARRFGPARLVRHEHGWASTDAVYQALDRTVATALRRNPQGVRAIYAYEDGALQSFRAAAELGIPRLYDLPIAHWRTLHRLLSEEAERLPEWAPTMEGLRDSAAKHDRKDEEIVLADQVIVPSNFVRNSIVEHFGTETAIASVPFGCPPPIISSPASRRPGEPLRLLFAGQLAQRKGIAYLISALEGLEVSWQLRLAGPLPGTPPRELQDFLSDPRCSWLGVVPHTTLMEEMTRAHVFVFPSIAEGMALVTTEALSAGLPVITTPNAGCDLVENRSNGYVVPIRTVDAISECLTTLAEDENLRLEMAYNALRTAANRPWTAYEIEIARITREWVEA